MSEITKRDQFDAGVGGEEITFELDAEDRLRLIIADEAELTIQWDGRSRTEVSVEAGGVTLHAR